MLVDEIYDALVEPEALNLIPHRLVHLTHGRSATLFSVENGEMGFNIDSGYYHRDLVEGFMRSGVHWKDPFSQPITSRGLTNQVVSSAELLPPGAFERTDYYDQLYRPVRDDVAHFLLGMLKFSGGYFALSIQRGRGSEPFSQHEVTAIQPLVPHLRRVLSLRSRLGLDQPSTGDLLEAFGQTALLTDGAGRLLLANAHGDRMLSSGEVLKISAGTVRARSPAVDRRLHVLIRCAAAGLDIQGGGALPLPVGEMRTLRAIVAPWRSGGRTRVLLVIDDPNRPDVSLPSMLVELYGFTGAEAQTVAALAQGLTPNEVAEARTVSVATVRTQIHHALRKSGARTIADLVRLAASLPRLGRLSGRH